MNTSAHVSTVLSSPKQQALELIQAMERCLDENDFGGRNPLALRRMQDLLWQLRRIDGPFGEKPGSIEHWADVFWSPRKYTRYDTTAESGADRVRQNLRQDLGSLRSLARQIRE